jgi:hypothetical protein
VNAGSGQRAQGGQGGGGLLSEQTETSGHLGQTGGTMLDFNTYKSSSPSGISCLRKVIPSLIVNPKLASNKETSNIPNKNKSLDFMYILIIEKIIIYRKNNFFFKYINGFILW